jgi:peroxin-3
LGGGLPASRSADCVRDRNLLSFSCRGFWGRHRRKILVSLGVAGVGYAAYRLYDAHRAQLVRVEQLRAREEQAAEDHVKNQ